MFILKRKLKKRILAVINTANKEFNETYTSDTDEASKRDAYMLHSGQISMAMQILYIIGGSKYGRASKNEKTVG